MTPASDERAYRLPDAPSLGRSIRSAFVDFYFNSWRLVPANLLWGLVLLGLVALLFILPVLLVPAAVLLALPTAGLFRLAGLIVRDEPVSFADSLRAWRLYLRPALASGLVLVVISFVLGFNIALALVNPEFVLLLIGMLSLWGLVIGWAVALPYWALLSDPLREDEPAARKLRVALALLFVSPLRLGLLLMLVTLVTVASTILFAALITVSVAFVALLVTRYSLPAADRLEGRETQPIPE